MFGQVLLGIAFIAMGIARILGLFNVMSKKERKLIKSENISSYMRKIGIMQTATGILFICMGIVQKYNLIPFWLFVIIYILASAIILLIVCFYNKKYLGYFMLW